MAKITMDSSEWESMKKVEKLLEESLAREKENNDKIRVLEQEKEQEKIHVLKANEKIMTIVRRTETTEYVQKKRTDEEITGRILRFAAEHFERRGDGFAHLSRSSSFSRPGRDIMGNDIDNLIEVFFTKHTLHSQGDGEETITTKGLDQVKQDIADDYAAAQSKKYIAKLEEANRAIEESKEIKKTFKEYKEQIKDAVHSNSQMEKDIKRLMKDKSLLEEAHGNEMLRVKKESLPLTSVEITRKLLYKHTGFNANARIVRELREFWKKED